MRKKMICVMLIVVLLGVSLVAQADILMDATFTEPDAAANAVLEAGIASARDIWQEALGMTDEDMEYGGYMTSYVQVQYGEGQEHAWVITLRDRTGECPAYIIVMLASTGEVILSEQYNPFAVLQAWEKTLGPFQLWEMEHRVRYDAFYQRFHDQNSGYFMPSGDEMPEAEAIEIANAALVAAGIKETVLEGLMPVTELYRSEYGHGSGKTDDSWIVSFFHPIPDAGGIYVAECTVMVDAFSGEVRNVVTQPGKG